MKCKIGKNIERMISKFKDVTMRQFATKTIAAIGFSN